MQRANSNPPAHNSFNAIGNLHEQAGKAAKLKFKAALLEAQDRDPEKYDYFRNFNDYWRYKYAGRMPGEILIAAYKHLNYNFLQQ